MKKKQKSTNNKQHNLNCKNIVQKAHSKQNTSPASFHFLANHLKTLQQSMPSGGSGRCPNNLQGTSPLTPFSGRSPNPHTRRWAEGATKKQLPPLGGVSGTVRGVKGKRCSASRTLDTQFTVLAIIILLISNIIFVYLSYTIF